MQCIALSWYNISWFMPFALNDLKHVLLNNFLDWHISVFSSIRSCHLDRTVI